MGALLPARVIDLGLREFGEVWGLQRDLVTARQRGEVPDTLLLVEHPHVVTLGRAAGRRSALAPGVPVFEIERGGDVTYHGPGQVVGYPIFLLREGERDLHLYLRNLEEALITTAAAIGVGAGRLPGATGVWTLDSEPRKLASIGVAVKRWVTMHGFALNVATELERFSAIRPCGLDPAVMTSLSERLGRPVSLDETRAILIARMQAVFDRDFST